MDEPGLELVRLGPAVEPGQALVEAAPVAVGHQQPERLADEELLGAAEQGGGGVVAPEDQALAVRLHLAVRGELELGVESRRVRRGLPAMYGWTGAFGIMVTVVWLYIEFLRFIAIFRGNN